MKDGQLFQPIVVVGEFEGGRYRTFASLLKSLPSILEYWTGLTPLQFDPEEGRVQTAIASGLSWEFTLGDYPLRVVEDPVAFRLSPIARLR